jgi:hypothetical protein
LKETDYCAWFELLSVKCETGDVLPNRTLQLSVVLARFVPVGPASGGRRSSR